MENSGQDLSSTANHFFSSGDGSAAASVESGWKSYIDYFMEMQQRQKGEASLATGGLSTDDVGRCRSTSEYSGDCGLGASTRLPALVEPSVVSRRLSLKEGWRRKKKVLYDESLEDTATSPISSPKLRDSDANHQRKGSSCDEISHSKKNTSDVNGANTTTDTTIKEDGAWLIPACVHMVINQHQPYHKCTCTHTCTYEKKV
ncbi:hypothetical protein PVAP13_6KG032900 [Panicum virgatum]|uniref:Uncharacterized protein n=1 Tax=Panicum virgatum TaxID=38727 RepID=A0A8T0R828_PANVG|nr:hypothetical protein PVAP13_6KG032900 [Panicum virgatum]KAG2581438.1 hypothetical protein PVAP13_6KG032900 [Panicum virgatum]